MPADLTLRAASQWKIYSRAHAEALLTSSPSGRTAYLEADLRRPQDILGHPRLAEVLDSGHRFLTAVTTLVQVDGRGDPADLVDDRAMVGFEPQPRAAGLNP